MDHLAEIEALMRQPHPELDPLAALRQRRPAWHADAACAGMGPSMFFPERGADVRPAKAICATCPVVDECRACAIDSHATHGIWAGESAARVRRRRSTAL